MGDSYHIVKNIQCPVCFQGYVETIIKQGKMVYAKCDLYPGECKFGPRDSAHLLRKSLQGIAENG